MKYNPEEIKLLKTVPWAELPLELKAKTIAEHDDPQSQQMGEQEPMA